MARDNVLPRVFSKLHPDYATPWVAILGLMIFAMAISIAIFITGKYLFIILMAAALECFIYVVMAICVLRLRKKFPDTPRDFKIPFGPVIPVITAVVFLGLMIGIFMDVSKDYSGRVLFANYWVAVFMAGFLLLCTLYTVLVVPVFKKKAAQKAATRVKRRPGKPEGKVPGPPDGV
jgi:amino acid transporter